MDFHSLEEHSHVPVKTDHLFKALQFPKLFHKPQCSLPFGWVGKLSDVTHKVEDAVFSSGEAPKTFQMLDHLHISVPSFVALVGSSNQEVKGLRSKPAE